MISLRVCVVWLILVCSLAALGNAQVVRYDITGFVTIAVDTNPAVVAGPVFGAQVNVGTPVAGFFEVDLSAPQAGASTFGGVKSFDFSSFRKS